MACTGGGWQSVLPRQRYLAHADHNVVLSDRLLEAAWPWRSTPRELALLHEVAADHASSSQEVTALCMAVDSVQATEFGGTDPLPPHIRATLEDLRADEAHLTAGWSTGASVGAYGDDWPTLPNPDPERLQERCATFVTMLTEDA